jgi:branched-chain amino acid transport system substrate-binding protein
MRKLAAAFAAAMMVSAAGTVMAGSTPGVTDKEVIFGAWTAMTGPLANYGLPGMAGAQAYISYVNDQGGVNGRKIKLVYEDNQYNPQMTVTAARKLVGSDGVFAIQGSYGTGPSSAAFPYLASEGVPFVMPYAADISWYDPVRPLVIGAQVPFDDQVWALGHWAAKDGFKNILVIHSAVTQFEVAAKHATSGTQSVSKDVKLEYMPVKFGTTDYAPIALEIRNKAPDAVIFVGAVQEFAALAKEVKQQGVKTQLYSYAGCVNLDLLTLGGDAVEGVRAVYYTPPIEADTPAMKEYRDILKKYQPKEQPDYISLVTFALAKISVEALRNAPEPLTRDSLVEGYYKLQNYDSGILGKVSFSKTRHLGTRAVQPMELKGGKWHAVGDFISPEG